MFAITQECDGCGECIAICPVEGAIVPGDTPGKPYVITTLCAECGACQNDCPARAIIEQ